MRPINKIILHSTYTPEGREHDVEDIRAWHIARGWKDIGYHYLIQLDGTIEQGRPLDNIGAHAKGYNQGSIGLVYVGGMSSSGRTPQDTRTPEQIKSISKLVDSLNLVLGGNLTVMGHNEVSSKACPCFDVAEEFPQYR
jgi:N-acetylmuramoyl-L-alanine amidase